jgi:hypothetical protein
MTAKLDETIDKRSRLVGRFQELTVIKGMSTGRAMDVCAGEFGYSFFTVFRYIVDAASRDPSIHVK